MRINWSDGFWTAAAALWTNRFRTFLTLLATIVSITSIIAVISIFDGTNILIRDTVMRAGTGMFYVQQVSALDLLSGIERYQKSLHNPKLKLADLTVLRTRVTLAEAVDASVSSQARVSYSRRHLDSVNIQGRSENYPVLGSWKVTDGRSFSAAEVMHRVDVAVLGSDVADELFGSLDPIGKRIKLGQLNVLVIGILGRRPALLTSNPNLILIIPITTFQKAFGANQSVGISIRPATLELTTACVDQTRMVLRSFRNLGPRQEDNFAIVTSESLLKFWDNISSMIFVALTGIVSLSMVVGGILIMNIMLASVTERRFEIGLRKALGATRAAILWQFLAEALIMSLCGGVIGTALGFAVAALVAQWWILDYAVGARSIVAGLALSITIGIFFGIYPAMRASKLNPIETLRYE